MAQYAYTFTSGDVVTPTKLNNARTVSEIVNADINNNAAIAGTKIAPDFGSQNLVTTASVATFQSGSTDGAVVSSLNSNNNGLWTWVGNASGGGAHIGKQVSSSSPPTLTLYKSRGGNTATPTVVSSGDGVGTISFKAHDGTGWIDAAAIGCGVDGTPGTNDMPGRLVFSTTADGASSVTERMRIQADGKVGIGTSSPGYMLDVTGIINTGSNYAVDGVQVVGNRRTGWTAPTGTFSRGTFDPSTVTLSQLAARVHALIDDLAAHGLIDS